MVDASSIELFCQQGEGCLSALIFPPKGSRQLELFTEEGCQSHQQWASPWATGIGLCVVWVPADSVWSFSLWT
jgi:hypothetical protein